MPQGGSIGLVRGLHTKVGFTMTTCQGRIGAFHVRTLAACAAVHCCAFALGQTPFEKVEPVNPPGSFGVRALTQVTVNPAPNRGYLSASSAISTTSARPTLFQYLAQSGSLTPVGNWLSPVGAGSWFEAHSICQAPSGGFVVAGRALHSIPGVQASAVVLLNASLNHVANLEPSGVDLTSENTKALALSTGEIVQMVNRPLSSGSPSAAIWVYSPSLSSVLGVYAYSTAACEFLRFTDMVLEGERLYVCGYKLHPSVTGATQSILLEIDVDTSSATFGDAVAMWTFVDFAAGTADSRFTAITVQPGSTPSVWMVGRYNDITQSFTIPFGRAVRFVPSTGAKPVDVNMLPRTHVPAGGISVAPPGICNLGAYLERLHVTGWSTNGFVGRHFRLDAFNGQVAQAWEFGLGTPPNIRFLSQVPYAGDPDQTLMVGWHQATGTSVADPYYVLTGCQGSTSCSVQYSLITAPFGGTVQVEQPITRDGWQKCDGSFGGVVSFTTRAYSTTPLVGSSTFTVCLGCPADASGDDEVGGADLGIMLASWGECQDGCAMDLDGNGTVDGADLGQLLAAWGPCN